MESVLKFGRNNTVGNIERKTRAFMLLLKIERRRETGTEGGIEIDIEVGLSNIYLRKNIDLHIHYHVRQDLTVSIKFKSKSVPTSPH